MAATSQASVSSEGLIKLQDELKILSKALMETYDSLCSGLKNLSEDWQDDMFEEFNNEFKDSKEEIREIAEKYETWATTYLQQRIEATKEVEYLSMGRR